MPLPAQEAGPPAVEHAVLTFDGRVWRALIRGVSFALGFASGLVAGCHIPEPKQNTDGPNWSGTLKPPPQPGNSLYESEECRCVTCRHEACCGGESEFSDDCGGTEECEMRVGSCARSCFESTWRVPKGGSCDARRPAACCAAG